MEYHWSPLLLVLTVSEMYSEFFPHHAHFLHAEMTDSAQGEIDMCSEVYMPSATDFQGIGMCQVVHACLSVEVVMHTSACQNCPQLFGKTPSSCTL